MAFTYLILNLGFLALVLVLFRRHLRRPTKAWWLTLGALLVLTAIFDNLMIWAGIFSYQPTLILGLHIGLAPIEDFMYAVLAAVLVPILWRVYTTNMEEPRA